MKCLLCKRLCDHHETELCSECQRFVSKNEYILNIKSLLKEAYGEVKTKKLRQKIEEALNII